MRPPTADLSIESTLRHCELLEALDDERIGELARMGSLRHLSEGEALLAQDETASDLFIVVTGRLAVRLSSRDGSVIEWFHAGQYRLLGWSSLVESQGYAADVRALEDSTVFVIPAAGVEQVLLRDAGAGYAVMKKIAGEILARLRDLQKEFIEQLADRDTR